MSINFHIDEFLVHVDLALITIVATINIIRLCDLHHFYQQLVFFRTLCIFLDIESFMNNARKVKLTDLGITFIDNLYLLTTCSIFGHQIE